MAFAPGSGFEEYDPKPQQGWQCPSCRRVNAPWKAYCDCQAPTPATPRYGDCGCLPGTVCGNYICPRAVRITCAGPTS